MALLGGNNEADVEKLVGPANEVKAEVEQKAAAQNQPKFECYDVVGGRFYKFKKHKSIIR